MNETQRILTDAKHLVEKGWVQRSYYRPKMLGLKDSYCMYGAIEAASGIRVKNTYKKIEDPTIYNEFDKALDTLNKCVPESEGILFLYNDSPNRTKKEVLEVFDCAIGKAV